MNAQTRSHIQYYYSPIMLKKLFVHALMIDIEDNNEKVDIAKEILGPDFSELGPGTNRFGMVGPDGYCHKIALDRRGIVDNITEFKRSPHISWCAPKVYECNGLIAIAENVELITREDFIANRSNVLEICEALSKDYIFEDIGFAGKNFCNWGIRANGSLVILDTGYMIPRVGNEEAMTCPVCGDELLYNSTYTGFYCKSTRCNTKFSFIDIYRRLQKRQIDDEVYSAMVGFELPNMDRLNDNLYNSSIMKGGHVHYERSSDAGGDGRPVNRTYQDIVRVEDIRALLSLYENGSGL